MFHRVQKVRVAPRRNVLLTFEGGDVVLFDVSPLIDQGGVFAALEDEDVFAGVQVEDEGHSVVWPGGIDFFAETLWREGTHVLEEGQRGNGGTPTAPAPA